MRGERPGRSRWELPGFTGRDGGLLAYAFAATLLCVAGSLMAGLMAEGAAGAQADRSAGHGDRAAAAIGSVPAPHLVQVRSGPLHVPAPSSWSSRPTRFPMTASYRAPTGPSSTSSRTAGAATARGAATSIGRTRPT